jgi:hypothetical protein
MVFHSDEIPRNEEEEILTNTLFDNWKRTISLFKQNKKINKLGLFPSSSNGFIWFNFWWVRGEYINILEEPIITEDRYYYESWLKNASYTETDSYSIYSNSIKDYSLEDTIINMHKLKNKIII